MKNLLFISFVLYVSLSVSQQELPEGWDKILLDDQVAYMNLITGDVTTNRPFKAAKKPVKSIEVDEYDPTITHKVTKGETLFAIARKYNIHIDQIYRLNAHFDYENIEVGQEIVVGYKDDKHYPVKQNLQHTNTLKHQFHIVIPGENLFRISKKYGLSIQQLKQLNRLNSNHIFVGQKLIVSN